MLRTIKRLGARYLPESLKAPLRGRLYGYREARVPLDWAAEPLPGTGMQRVRITDLQPIAFPDGVLPELEHHLSINGEAVEETHAFIREARLHPGVFYDVGAHTGYFTWMYTATHPDNRALAIDPSRPVQRVAAAIAEANGLADRVTLLEAAVSDQPGTTTAWIDALQFARLGTPGGADAYEVPITTVDGEVERTGWIPALMKIDVEGHEAAVLRGARRTLQAHRPVVFLELHLDEIDAMGGSPAAVLALLADAGYRFETLAGVRRSAAWFANRPVAVLRMVARPT